MKKDKKLTSLLLIGVLTFSLAGVTAMAATYSGYKLPARQGNNYTGTHSKTTTDNYIQNKVTDIENADTVTFWAANSSNKQISGDYDQKLNSSSKIKFNVSGYDRKNKDIKMGMENANWTAISTAFVAGKVDFR